MTVDVPGEEVEFAETNDECTIGKLASGDVIEREIVVDTDRLKTAIEQLTEVSDHGVADLAVLTNPDGGGDDVRLLALRDRDTGDTWTVAGRLIEKSEGDGDGVTCPECGEGELRVGDAIYADCLTCGASVERREVGL